MGKSFEMDFFFPELPKNSSVVVRCQYNFQVSPTGRQCEALQTQWPHCPDLKLSRHWCIFVYVLATVRKHLCIQPVKVFNHPGYSYPTVTNSNPPKTGVLEGYLLHTQTKIKHPKDRRNARICKLGKLNSPFINEWPNTDRPTLQGRTGLKSTPTAKRKWTFLWRQSSTGQRRSLVWEGCDRSHPCQVEKTIFRQRWWTTTLSITHVHCSPARFN